MSDNERADSPPRMPRRGRNADDPRMIGPWKIGRTIGKGASGEHLHMIVSDAENTDDTTLRAGEDRQTCEDREVRSC